MNRKVMTFSSQEIDLLVRIIDEYAEGTNDAKDATTSDRIFIDSIEDLLDSMSIYDEDLALLNEIKVKILTHNSFRSKLMFNWWKR